eukprot:10279472-Heterocapsa_arctica.AAC.1
MLAYSEKWFAPCVQYIDFPLRAARMGVYQQHILIDKANYGNSNDLINDPDKAKDVHLDEDVEDRSELAMRRLCEHPRFDVLCLRMYTSTTRRRSSSSRIIWSALEFCFMRGTVPTKAMSATKCWVTSRS